MSKELTVQWKAGKLEPYKRYYIKNQKGEITDSYLGVYYDELGNNSLIFIPADVVEVMAPIPTYKELRALQSSVNKKKVAELKCLLKECYSFIDTKKPNVVKLLTKIEEMVR